ncbi:hypothetical protein GWI33_017766 [Rhynchophorus ferrugineus]|uniref:Uncharacterized protein n=1 Tax=Rhynchophorus ferrugineus TaxID=354439 RepID=A0A834HXP6_RHYFE|nr:hypothetical protein GWI33_017766 [Rhynchophorus ferrugineus]
MLLLLTYIENGHFHENGGPHRDLRSKFDVLINTGGDTAYACAELHDLEWSGLLEHLYYFLDVVGEFASVVPKYDGCLLLDVSSTPRVLRLYECVPARTSIRVILCVLCVLIVCCRRLTAKTISSHRIPNDYVYMAMRTFQFCLVFAIGYLVQSTSALLSNKRALSADTPSNVAQNVSLRFLEEPEDVIADRGQNVTLRCVGVSSRGHLSVSWRYDGRPLPPQDPRWSESADGSRLHVVRVAGNRKTPQGGNVGDYACLVRNQVGAILSRTARIKLAMMDKDAIVLTENQTIYETQPLLLYCSVHSTPSADIQWEFNKLPLPKDKRYVPLPDGSLLIRNTKISDTGNYRCIAENIILKKTKYSKELEINVLQLTVNNIPPSILLVNSSVNKSAIDGDTVEFFCIVSGHPKPLVQWKDSNRTVLSNSSTLILKNVRTSQSGNYTCTARNPSGVTVKQFHLDVHQKPVFNCTPNSTNLPSAKTVRLDCQAKGVPQPRVYWLKDGEPFSIGGRIKKPWSGLVFSHTFTSDSGIYQCVAVNSVGEIWTAAQIEINNLTNPTPPQNLRCRPFDSSSVCLSWENPPNVTVQAYTINSYYTKGDEEVSGPEYIGTDTYLLADKLMRNINYTFYVRLYSKQASDPSKTVICHTGLKESRSLDIDIINSTSLMLKWNELSSDILCKGTADPYVVQWFRDGEESHISSEITLNRSLIVTDLQPATDYQFRVTTENRLSDEVEWIMYSIPDIHGGENHTIDNSDELRAPKYLHEIATTSTSTKISWDRIFSAKFYSVCYVPANENRECEDDDFIRSYPPKFSVSKLIPNTDYLFKVRAHNSKDVPGIISQPLKIHTHADVPSTVEDLEYKILSASAACIYWRPPKNDSGYLRSYIVSYTTDYNWSLENLIEYNVTTSQGRSQFCLRDRDEKGEIWSTMLTNLSAHHTYIVMVRAVNDFGVGQPLYTRLDISNNAEVSFADLQINSSVVLVIVVVLGIFVTTFIGGVCYAGKKCFKARALRGDHLPTSSRHHPTAALYTPGIETVQLSMDQLYSGTEHEIEHLVPEEQSSHIPPITPDHLDTKGATDFPNGHVNGSNKRTQLNGCLLNGNMHITENPQYYVFERNMSKNKSEPLLKRYEEDSNFDVRPFKYYFPTLFGLAKKEKEPNNQGSYSDHSQSDSLNSTQLTALDDSIGSSRRLSPVLEPNG